MLQLNGNWDSFGRYRDFNVDGIIVSDDSNYSQLNFAIAKHLMIDTSEKIIEIKYIVNEHYPSMKIRNDMGVRVYMETKKENKSLGIYCLVCVGDNCTWYFKSTRINDSALFKVRKFNSLPTCSLMDNTHIQCKPTATVVGSMVIPKYTDPKTIYIPKDIQTDMLSEHGVNLTYMQAWRAKEKALEFLRGHPADSYSRLPSYLYILEKTYPGSVVKLQKTDDDYFLYAFVALSTSIKGWDYCRPVIVVDGTFLKSAYKGIMLIASIMDVACSILPLAYAVVDSEYDASWK
ncbi:uncharacterized protein [Nicotiana tomentosiformis]|uniref:uncharacterized protein n=1 Tax=Nicotiana tomentosiformis TaxID=4098 RepID=UPI00388CB588